MRTATTLLLWVALGTGLAAQKTPARFMLTVNVEAPPADQRLYLWEVEGRHDHRLDSAELHNGQATFKKIPHPGQYRVGFNPSEAQSVVLGGTEKPVVRLARNSDKLWELSGTDPEQRAFAQLQRIRQEFEAGYNRINGEIRQRYQAAIDAAQKALLTDIFTTRTDSLAAALKARLDSLTAAHPATYTTAILVPLSMPIIPDRTLSPDLQAQDRRKHFFDPLPRNRPDIVYNDFLPLKIYQYLIEAGQNGEDGLREASTLLIEAAANYPEAFEQFVLNSLLATFGRRGPDAVLEELYTKYNSQVKDPWPELVMLRERRENLAVGKPAPALAMPTPAGEEVSLQAALGENLTLLYVWASTCGHCRVETPKVHDLYTFNRDKGFAVYAVSLDVDHAAWTEFVQEKGLEWTNVSQLKGWESDVVMKFGLRRTPYLVLLDANGNILENGFEVKDLEAKLSEYLGD